MHAKPDLRVPFLLADLSFRLGDRGRYSPSRAHERITQELNGAVRGNG